MKNVKLMIVIIIVFVTTGCAYTIETGPNGLVSRSALSVGVPTTVIPPVGVVRGGGYYAPAPAYGYGYPGYYAPPIGWAWGGGYWGGGWGDGHHHHHDGDTVNNFNNDGDVNIGDGSNFDGADGASEADGGGESGQ